MQKILKKIFRLTRLLIVCLLVWAAVLIAQTDPDFIKMNVMDDEKGLDLNKGVKDSVSQRIKFNLSGPEKSRPLNPYFRNKYQIIKDMRKLVRMFNYRAVNNYESLDQLVEISRKLPEETQEKIIGTAIAGGVANILSNETNKQLRKSKINFVKWKLEKVIIQKKLKYARTNIYAGYNNHGFGVSFPNVKVYCARNITKYYTADYFVFQPHQNLGVNYTKLDDYSIITPFITTNYLNVSASYRRDRKILTTRFELLKYSKLIIRIAHINFFEEKQYNRFFSEVLIYL